jgi:hypothetical protein
MCIRFGSLFSQLRHDRDLKKGFVGRCSSSKSRLWSSEIPLTVDFQNNPSAQIVRIDVVRFRNASDNDADALAAM